jgi:hypothetical protein
VQTCNCLWTFLNEHKPHRQRAKAGYGSVICGTAEAVPFQDGVLTQGLNRLRKKSLLRLDRGPQRLKPDLFSNRYVRANARTLQRPGFFRSL